MTLLKDSAFTWYQTQGVTAAHGWLRLRNSMMRYFKPADYAFKTQLALAKWQQRGSVTDYIVGFSKRYTDCADIDANEALFVFSMVFSHLYKPGLALSNPRIYRPPCKLLHKSVRC